MLKCTKLYGKFDRFIWKQVIVVKSNITLQKPLAICLSCFQKFLRYLRANFLNYMSQGLNNLKTFFHQTYFTTPGLELEGIWSAFSQPFLIIIQFGKISPNDTFSLTF